MFEITERSTAYLTASFFDKAGAAAAPSSVTYRVDCEKTGAALVPSSSVTPGQSVEITIPASANAMQEATNDFETKVVTVTANYGAGEQITAAYRYRVRNLSKIT